jgi:hypothetical protein
MSFRKETIGPCSDRLVTIYALCEPDTAAPRYVGKTVDWLHRRYRAHIRDAQARRSRRRPVCKWIRELFGAGKQPLLVWLEYVRSPTDWQERENHWICRLRSEGHDLLNQTEGGEGQHGYKWPVLQRLIVSKKLQKGSELACEQCGSRFWRKPKDIIKGDARFCSRACYHAWTKGRSRPVPEACMKAGIAAAAARRARTHCKRGHPLSGDNLFRTFGGGRGCKQCRRLHKMTYQEKCRHDQAS